MSPTISGDFAFSRQLALAVQLAKPNAIFTRSRKTPYSQHLIGASDGDFVTAPPPNSSEGTMAFRFDRTACALPRPVAYVAILVVCMMAQAQQSNAENFRIETKVFEGKKREAISETTTIFCDGVVYDFLKAPAQTAVFSRPSGKNAGRFILLNEEQQIRTEVSTKKLEGAMLNLRTWAGQQPDKYLKFAANPEFEESYEPGTGQLVLASHMESYTVETMPAKHPKAASEYREFLDWYAQLNTLLCGSPPPQPRLELNKSLSRHTAIPKTVELTRTGRDEPLRAEHIFTWMLSQGDMERIEEVNAALASYREVENEEYLRRSRGESEEK
jgi:hypothetical protein